MALRAFLSRALRAYLRRVVLAGNFRSNSHSDSRRSSDVARRLPQLAKALRDSLQVDGQ